jgi:predicted O-methyltransferase YrrM
VRARTVLELGTAYGMGTLFLAAAVGKEGVVTTVEAMQPQARISADVLAQHFPDRVRTLEGRSTEVVDEVASVVPSYDLFFHDAEHSHRAYVDDFVAYEPMLAPGAVVIYDDITWRRAKQLDVDPDPYGGWLEVVEHPRVIRAAEVDGDYGLLLLK